MEMWRQMLQSLGTRLQPDTVYMWVWPVHVVPGTHSLTRSEYNIAIFRLRSNSLSNYSVTHACSGYSGEVCFMHSATAFPEISCSFFHIF
jgi:hypothetical protein